MTSGRDYRDTLAQLRVLLGDARAALMGFGATAEDEEALKQSIQQLDALFLLVVVGEFNAGKSSFINALAGAQILEHGVTPTTTRIQVLKFGEVVGHETVDGITDEISAPVELLRDIHIVDTPGTNAIERHHEAITQKFLPRADIVFFLTSADRPLTESERQFLSQIRDWGKKVVIVLNKIDILDSEDDLQRVVAFINDGVSRLLGMTPEIFPVSTKGALQAKLAGDAAVLEKSRFGKLEGYMTTTLDEQERVRLKLLNPLGVALSTSQRYLKAMSAREAVLVGDGQTIEGIQTDLKQNAEEMKKEFQLRMADVDNVLHQFEQRGNDFFDDTIRLGRILDLRDKAKIKGEFERRVVADLPKQVDEKVHEIIDWLVASDLKQWEGFRARLMARRSEQADVLAGNLSSGFQYDRTRLLDTVGKTAERTVEDYNREAEANRIADSLETAVRGIALMGAGAIGLGVAVAALATTAAADVTGILAVGTLATVGLLILPHRKQVARRELREKTSNMRKQLLDTLGVHFDKEVSRSTQRVEDALTPYRRFVAAEREKLAGSLQRLRGIEGELVKLRSGLERD